jgi:stage II sporulation protein R
LESAVQKCEKILPLIEEGAREFALSQGYDEEITAEITKMRFNTRVYDTATLPAGEYTALRIRVGEAKGKNWWCVMFPALCLPAVSEPKSDTVPVINLPETVQDSPKIKFAVFEFLSVFFNPSS